jgi:diacylglycerol kinase family enzyme
LATLRSYGYPELRVQWQEAAEDSLLNGDAGQTAVVRWLFGMNLSKYPLGFNFAPKALGTDGLLDVCTFSKGSMFDSFRYAWGLFTRRHLKYRDTRMIRCSRMRIEGPDGIEVPYQLDGDFGGYLPVEVCMLPGRLRFLVDAVTADRLVSTSHA